LQYEAQAAAFLRVFRRTFQNLRAEPSTLGGIASGRDLYSQMSYKRGIVPAPVS